MFLIITPEHIEWWWSLAVMAGFFGVGFLIFSLNIMGGGDIKLLIALSLWIGLKPDILMAFLMVMALSGGVLTLFLIFVRKAFIIVGVRMKKAPSLPRVFMEGEPVPYGVAIAYSFAYLLWSGKMEGFGNIAKSLGV